MPASAIADAQKTATPSRAQTAVRDLTSGPVGVTIRRLAVPMVAGMASATIFNLVDTAFAGRLGTEALAALGFTFPVVAFLGAFSGGLSMAATAVLSRHIGANDTDQSRRTARDAILLAVTIVGIFSVVGYFTIDPLFGLLGAQGAELDLVGDYMGVWYLGMVMLVVPMVSNGAIRATGDTTSPAVIMIIAGVTNAALDPLFMFGPGPFPELGLQGAAIASVLARTVTLIASLWLLTHRQRLVSFERPTMQELANGWVQLARIAAPAGLANAIVPISLGALTAIVAGFGTDELAAFTAGSRITGLLAMAAVATGAGLIPFVGQNLGAGRTHRIRTALNTATRTNLALAAVGWIAVAALAGSLAAAFTGDPTVAEHLSAYLRIAGLAIIPQAMLLIGVATLNAMQHARTAAIATITRVVALLVPLAWLGGRLYGINGVWVAIATAEALAAALTWRLTLKAHQAENTIIEDRTRSSATAENESASRANGVDMGAPSPALRQSLIR